jgi:2-hydroxychromene-2-carboxylate isomerase
MGDVIKLADRRDARRSQGRARPLAPPLRAEYFFDLSCPFSYLTAERVDRMVGDVTWVPASAAALRCGALDAQADVEAVRLAAEQRAHELRLPLVWPERWPAEVPAAMRAASFAAGRGRGAAFVLAAGRLAFCGGFDLDDPETLAEAAAAAGIGMAGCLRAIGDVRRDGAMEIAGRRLLAAGADRLPALVLGRALYWGESRVAQALAAVRLQAAAAAR